MEIIGFVASILMGISLGLIGGGGSILTVPILVYLFGVNPVISTAYSLFVVGLTSAVGSYSHFKKGNVHLKTALIFGIPSIIAVYTVRKYIVPLIPDPVFLVDNFLITKNLFVMILFALLMVIASLSMIRKSKITTENNKLIKYNLPIIFIEGLIVGSITGLVGAGGGFLIIPALVLFAGLPMKQAVGTSLLIIAMKSLIGFTGDLGSEAILDFKFMLIFSAFATVGIIAGTYFSKFISNEKLKPVFGWFVLVMGLYILTKEIFFNGL
ncbi:MAG: sulfite exporter TauE/SafE family protein [Cyclobacteriaceae bacterium]